MKRILAAVDFSELTGPTVRESARLKIQCLVLGSHGHGALYRTLMGSVCEGVLRKATCPLLIVPTTRGRR